MFNPPHPGIVIKEEILNPLGLTVEAASKLLDIPTAELSAIIEGKAPITPPVAVRLEMAFKPSADSWLRQQAAYDLWHARRNLKDLQITPVSTENVAHA